jgi:hypothetical protein
MTNTSVVALPRSGLRKFIFALAIFSIVLAVGAGGGTVWAYVTLGSASTVTPSLFATTLFFLSVAFVLHVVSKQPPALDSATADEGHTGQ